ncbi:armadillo-type protein [Scheffersomyces coipomensis]|uniref:armadillo-type protein n=1 Tax=Scheffersomyces coipomensis TaxID=1788519 RepID=UPI00315C5239
MSTNYTSRSASISTAVDDATKNLSKFSKPGLRSASFGSNFFAKDAPSFLSPTTEETTAPTTAVTTAIVDLSSNSLDDNSVIITKENDVTVVDDEDAKPSELDIVGALVNLDLDDDYTESSQDQIKQSQPPNDQPKSTIPFSNQPLYGGDNYPFYNHPYHPHQGSLTPNPSLLGNGAGPFGNNTPSSTWNNNFIPSSAPPFGYNNNSNNNVNEIQNDLPMFIKPFELPSEEGKENKADHPPFNNLHLPFSTPPPPPPPHSNQLFGGILDSNPPFMIPPPSASGNSNSTQSNTPDIENITANEGAESSTTTTGEIPAIPFHNPIPTPPNNGNQQQFHLTDNFSMPPPSLGGLMPPPPHPHGHPPPPHQLPPAGMWNHQPPLQMHPNMRNAFMDNRMIPPPSQSPGPHHPSMLPPPPPSSMPYMNQFNGNMRNNNGNHHHHRHNRNGGNYGYMSESNIHRKVHNNNNGNNHNNNRRKGEDASKYVNAKLEDFVGQIFNLCKDQHGCRFLQRQLDLGKDLAEGKLNKDAKENTESSEDEDASNSVILTNDIAATMIFNEIYLKIVELMTDPFGNYLVQKLFENVSNDQRIILVKNSSVEFVRIALDPHGTRALQKLVDCISTEEESKIIIESLGSHIVSLSRDLNGNHVVQKCLQKLKPADNQFIFDAACLNCNEIATHRHGCCVLQRCLDNGDLSQRKQLSLKVAENATNLSLDPFGNYVVQYVLSRGDNDSIQMIMNHIKSNIISLSLHKFGSNVIEKSLRIHKLTDNIIDELLQNTERFNDLLNDAFGNYVLQTSLDVAAPQQLTKLSQALQPLLLSIKNTPHGRRILSRLQNVV